MSMDLLPFTEFSEKTLVACQKWRDENYERNTEKRIDTCRIKHINK